MEYSPQYVGLRALLCQIREEAGLTQRDLAKKLGKSQAFVWKSEAGERRIDLLETINFCTACNITMTKFLKRLQKPAAKARAKPKRSSPRKVTSQKRLTKK